MRNALLILCLLLSTTASAQDGEQPRKTRAVVLLLHTNEIPDGTALAVQITQQVRGLLHEGDSLGVFVYGPDGNTWAVPLGPVEDTPQGDALVRVLDPGDMPDFDSAFRVIHAKLGATQADTKMVVVISDGDPSPPAPRLLVQFRNTKITVHTVCVLPHSGATGPAYEVMTRIADRTRGRRAYLETLPEVILVTRSFVLGIGAERRAPVPDEGE